VTTLKSMPIILSDDDRTTNMEITPGEDKENVSIVVNFVIISNFQESNDATVIAELQREVAMYKERAERAEQESRHNEEKAGKYFRGNFKLHYFFQRTPSIICSSH
jgi:hypothetical protein